MTETVRRYMLRRLKETGVRDPMINPVFMAGWGMCPRCTEWVQGAKQVISPHPSSDRVEFVCEECA